MKNLFALALSATVLAGAADAATLTAFYNDSDYTLNSVVIGAEPDPLVAISGTAAFLITFDDTLGSATGVLEAGEFESFTWLNDPYDGDRNDLRVVPDTAVSDYFRLDGNPSAPANNFWVFGLTGDSGTTSIFQTTAFTYTFDAQIEPPPPNPAAIPLPPAMALILVGLGGIAAVGRRKRS
jgi:hypothetical protein